MSNYRHDYRSFQKEYFWTLPRALFAGAIGLAGICAIDFGLNYAGYAQFSFFNPRYEQVSPKPFQSTGHERLFLLY